MDLIERLDYYQRQAEKALFKGTHTKKQCDLYLYRHVVATELMPVLRESNEMLLGKKIPEITKPSNITTFIGACDDECYMLLPIKSDLNASNQSYNLSDLSVSLDTFITGALDSKNVIPKSPCTPTRRNITMNGEYVPEINALENFTHTTYLESGVSNTSKLESEITRKTRFVDLEYTIHSANGYMFLKIKPNNVTVNELVPLLVNRFNNVKPPAFGSSFNLAAVYIPSHSIETFISYEDIWSSKE